MDARVLALLSALCFGVNPIVLKVGLKNAKSDVAVLVGLLSGVPLLILVSPALGGFRFAELTPLAALYFILGGLTGIVLGRSALYLSIKHLGSARASTIKNGAPVVTAFLALIFLQEFIAWERWGGIILVTIGLILVGGMLRQQTAEAVTLSGLAIASLTPVFYGIRAIFSKLGLELSPLPLAATFVSYVTAVILYLGYFVVRHQIAALRTDRWSLLYFTIGGVLQVFGLLLLNFALELDEVTVIYPISASAPLVTFLLSYTVLQNIERLTFWDFVGTASVVAGVIILLI